MTPDNYASALCKIAEQQLRRQNANTMVVLLFGQISCPEPILQDYLDAYVMGEPLPHPVWHGLMQRLKAVQLP